jgi:hypothetical protein
MTAAEDALCETGLFTRVNLGWEAKYDDDLRCRLDFCDYTLNFPSLRTTDWTDSHTLILLPTSVFNMHPLENFVVEWPAGEDWHISGALANEGGLDHRDIVCMSFPRLKPLMSWLAKRAWATKRQFDLDRLEDLVDSLDLTEAWVKEHLQSSPDEDNANSWAIKGVIVSKGARLTHRTQITRYIRDVLRRKM